VSSIGQSPLIAVARRLAWAVAADGNPIRTSLTRRYGGELGGWKCARSCTVWLGIYGNRASTWLTQNVFEPVVGSNDGPFELTVGNDSAGRYAMTELRAGNDGR
jgi:hypothetical protein